MTQTNTVDDAVFSSNRQREARLAGFAYLLTIAAGLFAQAYARASLRVAGDAVATSANIRAGEALYRGAIAADLVMLASYAVVTVLLYRLFRPAGPAFSLAAAAFSMTGIALLAANTGLLAAPLLLLGDASALAPLAVEQREALTFAALRMHDAIYGYAGFFFGLYCVSIGWLAWRSDALPKLVAVLMFLAGLTFIADTGLTLLRPDLAARVPNIVMLISLLGEGALALCLALFGVRTTSPAAGDGTDRG